MGVSLCKFEREISFSKRIDQKGNVCLNQNGYISPGTNAVVMVLTIILLSARSWTVDNCVLWKRLIYCFVLRITATGSTEPRSAVWTEMHIFYADVSASIVLSDISYNVMHRIISCLRITTTKCWHLYRYYSRFLFFFHSPGQNKGEGDGRGGSNYGHGPAWMFLWYTVLFSSCTVGMI